MQVSLPIPKQSYSSPGATTIEHAAFDVAYKFFNMGLFGTQLPDCLITLQRKGQARGYFHRSRFGSRDGSNVTDEIALNPAEFANRSDEEVLSTLAHEMVHCWQAQYGNPSRSGYHNREWADKMLEIGLIPSATGKTGGAQVGQRMTHYIVEHGRFKRACRELLSNGFRIAYVETGGAKREDIERVRSLKRASHMKFACPRCRRHVRGNPKTEVDCRSCHLPMLPDE